MIVSWDAEAFSEKIMERLIFCKFLLINAALCMCAYGEKERLAATLGRDYVISDPPNRLHLLETEMRTFKFDCNKSLKIILILY